MDAEDLNQLARTRAEISELPLKKLIKDFYKLVNEEVEGEELLAAHEIFLLDLDHFASTLDKSSRLLGVARVEVEGYDEESRIIQENHNLITADLVRLKKDLVVAQSDRANMMIYDAMAKRIGKLPSRSVATEANSKLIEDVRILEEEQTTYAATWASRQAAFDEIVNGLVMMSESIRDEKAEQARRRALDDDDEVNLEVPPPIAALVEPTDALPPVPLSSSKTTTITMTATPLDPLSATYIPRLPSNTLSSSSSSDPNLLQLNYSSPTLTPRDSTMNMSAKGSAGKEEGEDHMMEGIEGVEVEAEEGEEREEVVEKEEGEMDIA